MSGSFVLVGTLLFFATFFSYSFDLFLLAFLSFLFVRGELLVLTHGDGDVLALSFLGKRLGHIFDRVLPVIELGLVVLGCGSVFLGGGRRRFALLYILDCRGGGVGFHSGVSGSACRLFRLRISVSSCLLVFVLFFIFDDLAALGCIWVVVCISS